MSEAKDVNLLSKPFFSSPTIRDPASRYSSSTRLVASDPKLPAETQIVAKSGLACFPIRPFVPFYSPPLVRENSVRSIPILVGLSDLTTNVVGGIIYLSPGLANPNISKIFFCFEVKRSYMGNMLNNVSRHLTLKRGILAKFL